jgi:hypothetical protein
MGGRSLHQCLLDRATVLESSQPTCTRSLGTTQQKAILLWWHDSTARDYGEGNGDTTRLFSTPSLNVLDHTKLLPGDLAVTDNGIHILAFLGGNQWIEADPNIGRVVTVSVPAKDNSWFEMPMNIVRWNIFQQ